MRKGEERQLSVLFSRLKNADTTTRRQVVHELEQIGGDGAAKMLTLALRDKDRGVQDAAHWALLSLEGGSVAPLLIPLLSDEDTTVRNLAMETLVDMGPVATSSVISELTHSEGGVRELAADILRDIGSSAATESLIVALEDEDSGVLCSVIEALGAIGDRSAVDPLVRMFEQREDLRSICAEALGRIGDPSATSALVQGLQGEDLLDVFAAVEALGEAGDEQCVDRLIALLETDEEAVREPAICALFQIAERCGLSLWRLSQEAGAYVLAALRSGEEGMLRMHVIDDLEGVHREETVAALMPFFRELDRDLREHLIRAIGEIGDTTYIDVLHVALEDEDLWVAYRSAQVLERIGDERSVPLLVEMLEGINPLLRLGAVCALGGIGDQRALGPLANVSSDDPEIHEAVLHAVERIQRNDGQQQA